MTRSLLFACLILYSPFLFAQRTVTGTVWDEARNPFFGVIIELRGSKTGAVTNSQGHYALMIPDDKAELAFSFEGYETQVIRVDSRSVLNVQLFEEIPEGDEMITDALGMRIDGDQSGAAYSKIDPEAAVRSGEGTLLNGMAAKAAGVRIARTSGAADAGVQLSIRGAATLTGNSDPLILIDGVPLLSATLYDGANGGRISGIAQQSRLHDINPQDIEAIDILKGPSAVALWGSRAANGIVSLTTKSGKAGKPVISFRTALSIDELSTEHPVQQEFGQGRGSLFIENSPFSWGDRIADRSGSPDELDVSGIRLLPDSSNTAHYPITQKNARDIFTSSNAEQVIQQGRTWKNDLSIRGGNENSRFYFGLGHLDQEGTLLGTYYDRINLRLNNDTKFNDWLSMSTRTMFTHSDANRAQHGPSAVSTLFSLLHTPPDFDNSVMSGSFFSAAAEEFTGRHRSFQHALGGPGADPIVSHPLWTTQRQQNTSLLNRYQVSSALHIDPIKWLGFTFRGGMDTYQDRRIYFFPVGSAGADRVKGLYNESLIAERQFNFDAMARTQFKLGAAASLEGILGWNYNDRNRRLNYTEIRAFLANVDLQTTDLNTSDNNSSVTHRKRFIRANRLYGQSRLSLLSRLYLTLGAAQEATSSFSNTAFYPTADLAWQFVRPGEGFLVSFGKARLSWGKSGTLPQAHRFETLAQGAFTYSSFNDGLSISQFGGGFRIDDTAGNPDLVPETQTAWEIGTDLRFFNNKLGFSATYYQNRIKDLLVEVDRPPSSGFLREYLNVGEMENSGIEVQLDYTVLKIGGLYVNPYLNFHHNQNRVTALGDMESYNLTEGAPISSRAVVGHPLGVLWGTRILRNADETADLDENGFLQIAPEPGIIGDPNPDWRGGFGIRAGLSNFHIHALLEHSQGGQFAEFSRFMLQHAGTHSSVGREIELEEAVPDFSGTLIPAGSTVRGNLADFGGGTVLLDELWYTHRGAGPGPEAIQELAITDATWTRLRELSLRYTFDGDWLKRWHLATVDLALTGLNLLLITDVEGADPELTQFGVGNSLGLDYYTQPNTRSYLVSLTITY